jgi:hypothetical protein
MKILLVGLALLVTGCSTTYQSDYDKSMREVALEMREVALQSQPPTSVTVNINTDSVSDKGCAKYPGACVIPPGTLPTITTTPVPAVQSGNSAGQLVPIQVQIVNAPVTAMPMYYPHH